MAVLPAEGGPAHPTGEGSANTEYQPEERTEEDHTGTEEEATMKNTGTAILIALLTIAFGLIVVRILAPEVGQ